MSEPPEEVETLDDPLGRVSELHALARQAHAGLECPLEKYVTAVRDRLGRRPGTRLADLVHADLYLTAACEVSADGAWQRLCTGFQPRLAALLRRRGASANAANESATEVIDDLALPAARDSQRLRIANYDATGSLFAWLGVLAARRCRRSPGPNPSSDTSETQAPGLEPGESLVMREEAVRFAGDLRASLVTLSPAERLALVAKHCDEMPQVAIAKLLRVGPPRVSRILEAARKKVRLFLGKADPEQSWRVLLEQGHELQARIAHVLATTRQTAAPTMDEALRDDRT